MRRAVVFAAVTASLALVAKPPASIAQTSPSVASFDGGAARDASVVDGSAPSSSSDGVWTELACTGINAGAALGLVADVVHVDCDDRQFLCSARLVIRLDNCSSQRVSLDRARLRRTDGAVVEWNFERQWVAPGASHSQEVRYTVNRDQSFVASLTMVDANGADLRTVSSSLTVVHDARRRARAACDACHGVWGAWGIQQLEACNCRAADAGRACEDGADCEGLCVPTGTRVVTPAVAQRCECPAGCRCTPARPRRRGAPLEALCAPVCTVAQPATVVSVGRCSEFRMNFGCRSYIPTGARAAGPFSAAGLRRASSRCAD